MYNKYKLKQKLLKALMEGKPGQEHERLNNELKNWANDVISNFGITIKGVGEFTDSSRYFDLQTKENSNPDVHPQLIVNYTMIPEPVFFNFLIFGIIMFFNLQNNSIKYD